jgi:large subunit ribosomal protein L24
VLQVLPGPGRAVVEGINLVKKALRKTQENPKGGIAEKEAPLAMANLMLACPTCKRGVRISHARDGDKQVRKCRRCGHAFDA